MDGYGNNDIADLYPRPASACCVNSAWAPFDPSSSLSGSTSGERLEHLVKSRPRKPKTRAPTRASIISTSLSSSTIHVDAKKSSCSNGHLKPTEPTISFDKIDDGLDVFFRKPALKVTESSTPKHQAHSAPKTVKQSVKQLNSIANVDKLQEKSTTSSSKSPTKAIQKIIKSFEIRVNRESVK